MLLQRNVGTYINTIGVPAERIIIKQVHQQPKLKTTKKKLPWLAPPLYLFLDRLLDTALIIAQNVFKPTSKPMHDVIHVVSHHMAPVQDTCLAVAHKALEFLALGQRGLGFAAPTGFGEVAGGKGGHAAEDRGRDRGLLAGCGGCDACCECAEDDLGSDGEVESPALDFCCKIRLESQCLGLPPPARKY